MEQNVTDWEAFSHPIYRVRSVQVVGLYTLHVLFDDHSEQIINFQAVLVGELYGPLQDPALFNQVQVDLEAHTLVWPNGADFDPATLHDWPQQAGELSERVQRWQRAPAGIAPAGRT